MCCGYFITSWPSAGICQQLQHQQPYRKVSRTGRAAIPEATPRNAAADAQHLLLVPDPASHNPFAPPDIPVEVYCSHCGRVFESWQMVWLDDIELPGGGVWCCP